MYSATRRRHALDLVNTGASLRSVSRSSGVSRSSLREWRDHPEKLQTARNRCPRCGDDPVLPEPRADYAYLLGLYLGDGCISIGGNAAKRVWRLRVMCADAWPADGERWYEYPRYLFSNKSTDILALCGEALDRLGVEWRFARWDMISVARKGAVARLDEFVGPKY